MVAHGDLRAVARVAHAHRETGLLVFEDATGRAVDLDLRGSAEDCVARIATLAGPDETKPTRGRPKLGVTAREVTLLPRHWDWLATQPGGASATLRRLVEQARRESGGADELRQAQEATYKVMTALAGNLSGYEEATRALFANDRGRFDSLISTWPADVADYLRRLISGPDAPSA
jgi:hypothetical protein